MDNSFEMIHRPRRLRRSAALRSMVRETDLSPRNLMLPMFVCGGEGVREPVTSMPGVFHLSLDNLVREADWAHKAGVPAVLLFGIPDKKDERASEAVDKNGIVPQAIRALKNAIPELIVATDVCVCAYTDHGHCGILKNNEVDNDPSIELLGRMAVAHAAAGADIVAPSAMMDDQIAALRGALDSKGLKNTAIMAYSAKYASAFYGPFREAADSAPQQGDRKSYQMDPGNAREAITEVMLDIEQGADIVMVKPALAYLDIIRAVRDTCDLPLAAYNVSGEYSMVKAAAEKNWVDEKAVALEILTSIRRAGAGIIITYWAVDACSWLT